MLTSLTLQNFALAKQLHLDIKKGFTVVTGETGAGKSILIDALSACLGERADAGTVRFGADKADVSAQFVLPKAPEVLEWLNTRELLDTHDDELILRRVITHEGRSKAWINGTPSSISDLRELGGMLVQLHSQHSQQELLKPDFARIWLDIAAGLQADAIAVENAYNAWQTLLKTQKKASTDASNRLERISYLEEALEEFSPLTALNYIELEQEFDQLGHFESMMHSTASMLASLQDDDVNMISQISSLLKLAENQRNRAPIFEALVNHFNSAKVELDEALSTLQRFADEQIFDPERFAYLDKTLAEFHRIARKYRIEPQELTVFEAQYQTELNELTSLFDNDALLQQVEAAAQNYLKLAKNLDKNRADASFKLAPILAENVKTLALPEAQFTFELTPLNTPSSTGLSQVELLFSANKGIPMQALAKVVSGGELSRITLVMNLLNAERILSPVLVFDEIDVGISGGTAEVVGRLLRNMGQKVQVLCITHQPQVAAQGDWHLLVEKVQSDPAASSIRELNEDDRIEALARMSGGLDISEITLQHARSLRQSVLSS